MGKASDGAFSPTDLALCDGTSPSSCNLRTAWGYILAYMNSLACPRKIITTVVLNDQFVAQMQSSTLGALALSPLFLTWASVCTQTSVSIILRGGAQSVVNGDGGMGSLFYVTGPPRLTFTVQDLAVVGFGAATTPRGGAMYISSIWASLFVNVQFVDNRGARGGAVYATATTVNMTHTNFTSNQVSE